MILKNFYKTPNVVSPTESTSSLCSEDGFEMLTNNKYKNGQYPKKVKAPNFYRLNRQNFNTWSDVKTGASLYRYTCNRAPHVGFFFNKPINFLVVAKQYGLPIRNNLISVEHIQGKDIQRADISTHDPEAVLRGKKADIHISLRSARPINEGDFFWYNKRINPYNPYQLALSIVLANNAHSENYFREHGLVCYTFCRDVILIYNTLLLIPGDYGKNRSKQKRLTPIVIMATLIVGISIAYSQSIPWGIIGGSLTMMIGICFLKCLWPDRANRLGIILDMNDNNDRLLSLLEGTPFETYVKLE